MKASTRCLRFAFLWRNLPALVLGSLLACGAEVKPVAGARSAAGSGAAVPMFATVADAGSSVAADNSNPVQPVTGAAAPKAGMATTEPECGRQTFDLQRKPADILLVLDRSGSMKNQVDEDDDNAPAKWDVVVPALKEVIMATDAAVSWGLKVFPEGDDAGECSDKSYPASIAVGVRPNNAVRVNEAITATSPKGDGTPTGDAIDEAVKYLQGVQDQNRKYILLATDGEPSCAGTNKDSSDARTTAVSALERAAAAQIHTFVVGIATTKDSASKTLTALAKAGQEAPAAGYYLASTKAELAAAVRQITGAAASCRFSLASKPPNPEHVAVKIGAVRVKKDSARRDGWEYVDDSLTAVELFGPACDAATASATEVSVVFGCAMDPLF